MALEEAFRYTSLDPSRSQIRLLVLQSTALEKEEDVIITAETRTFDLESAPKYTALSYVWGAPLPAYKIKLDNQIFTIRRNLFGFLLRARKVGQLATAYLWVDQICINQADQQEKTEQVAKMDRIYAEAYMTIAWLGYDLASPRGRWPEVLEQEKDSSPLPSGTERVQWGAVLSQEYWTRLWIVQELALSPNTVFWLGQMTSIPLDALLHDYKPLLDLVWEVEENGTLPDQLEFLHDAKKFLAEQRQLPAEEARGEKWFSLYEAFHLLNHMECTVVHDRIYALLSLVRNSQRLTPDYTISTELLFKRFERIFRHESNYRSNPVQYLSICAYVRRALKLAEDEQTIFLVLLSALRENVFDSDGHAMLREYIGGKGRVRTPDDDSILRRAMARIRADAEGKRASGIEEQIPTSAVEMQERGLSFRDDVFSDEAHVHSSPSALEDL